MKFRKREKEGRKGLTHSLTLRPLARSLAPPTVVASKVDSGSTLKQAWSVGAFVFRLSFSFRRRHRSFFPFTFGRTDADRGRAGRSRREPILPSFRLVRSLTTTNRILLLLLFLRCDSDLHSLGITETAAVQFGREKGLGRRGIEGAGIEGATIIIPDLTQPIRATEKQNLFVPKLG